MYVQRKVNYHAPKVLNLSSLLFTNKYNSVVRLWLFTNGTPAFQQTITSYKLFLRYDSFLSDSFVLLITNVTEPILKYLCNLWFLLSVVQCLNMFNQWKWTFNNSLHFTKIAYMMKLNLSVLVLTLELVWVVWLRFAISMRQCQGQRELHPYTTTVSIVTRFTGHLNKQAQYKLFNTFCDLVSEWQIIDSKMLESFL